jgi:hypothetical protein
MLIAGTSTCLAFISFSRERKAYEKCLMFMERLEEVKKFAEDRPNMYESWSNLHAEGISQTCNRVLEIINKPYDTGGKK